MSDDRPAGETTDPPASDSMGSDSRERVARALRRVEAGVRQRRSELATLGEKSEELRLSLAELKKREFVEEPPCVSPRPVIGRLLVFLRKAGFHLFVKWWARPVLQQQNSFNQVASGRIQSLAFDLEDLEHRLEQLAQRLDRLEAEELAPCGMDEGGTDEGGTDESGTDEGGGEGAGGDGAGSGPGAA